VQQGQRKKEIERTRYPLDEDEEVNDVSHDWFIEWSFAWTRTFF
jgi:hypothetical protein